MQRTRTGSPACGARSGTLRPIFVVVSMGSGRTAVRSCGSAEGRVVSQPLRAELRGPEGFVYTSKVEEAVSRSSHRETIL